MGVPVEFRADLAVMFNMIKYVVQQDINATSIGRINPRHTKDDPTMIGSLSLDDIKSLLLRNFRFFDAAALLNIRLIPVSGPSLSSESEICC